MPWRVETGQVYEVTGIVSLLSEVPMPWRAPTDSSLRHSRRLSDQRHNQERAAKRGPDPRSTARRRRVRALKLAQDPLCQDPYGVRAARGRVEAATQVDYIREVLALTRIRCQVMQYHILGLTLRLSCCRKRERSGRWRQSAAGGC
jgi:hypothetical protein